MANLLGVDVSRWQGEMDWEQCKNAGAGFAFARAGSCTAISGNCYIDFHFYRNATLAPMWLPVGFYWYYRPQHNPIEQANYFYELIKDEDWKLPPVADIESSGGLSPSDYADSVKEFLDHLESLANIKPIIYTSRYKWAQVEPRPYWSEYDLWVAHYTSQPEPLLPLAWNDWTFWQWSADGNGRGAEFGAESHSIDLDYFNGNQEEFDLYINKQPIAELPASIGVKVDIEGVKYRGHIEKV